MGTAPGLIYGGVHEDSEIEVYRELLEAVEEAIVLYQKDGRQLPPPTLNSETREILFRPLSYTV